MFLLKSEEFSDRFELFFYCKAINCNSFPAFWYVVYVIHRILVAKEQFKKEGLI